MFYRKVTNFIEKRRETYWSNDKYHLGTSVKTDNYIDNVNQWGPDHKNVPGFDAL